MNPDPAASPARRALVTAAWAVALVSLACVAAILAVYAAGGTPWAALVAVGLYGLPLAVVLLAAAVVLAARDRRRA